MNQQLQDILSTARESQAKGNFQEALSRAKEANRLDPAEPAAYQIMAQCERSLGRFEEALKIFDFLCGHFPEDGNLRAEMAATKWGMGKKAEGYELAKKAVEMSPDSRFALEILGSLSVEYECWPKAIETYRILIEKWPDMPVYYTQISQAYNTTFQYDEAIEAFQNVLRLQGETAHNLYQMGMFFFLGRRFEEAVPWFEKAVAADPENDEPVFYLARCHIQFGDLKKGLEFARKALAIKPDSIHTLTLLNEIDPGEIQESQIRKIHQRLEEGKFDGPLERALNHLFLGKYYHKAKDFDAAFAQFKAANDDRYRAFASEGMSYSPKLMEDNYAETKRIFTREEMKKMAGQGSKSEVPILIVSMPRSGTTLLEQMIASHPKVHGAGELSTMSRVFFDLNYAINSDPNRPITEIIKNYSREWAGIYLDELRLPSGKIRATDKMPVNFIHLGIFQAMFPNARVLYIRRHPLDTCLSMYSNNMSDSYAYTARLDHLGHYFNLHADLMRHWKENLDMKYLEVDYAGLVAEPEKKAREIIEFCGLEWEDKVLEFYKGRKSAYTISQVQVSEPINKKGIGRWKPYKKYIGPLIEALDEDIVGPLGVDDK